jgi:endonuclease/exonuclease/phosphatase family metal-dependent hydrolase
VLILGLLFFMPAVLGPPGADPPALTINEVDADQAGVDGAEFVEVAGPAGVDLTGVSLVLYNGASDGDAAYRVVALAGEMPDDGLLVAGSTAVPSVDVPVWSSNALQNGADAVALMWAPGLTAAELIGTPAASPPEGATLLDAVVYGVGSREDRGLVAALAPGGSQVDEDLGGLSAEHSLQRLPGGRADCSFFVLAPTPGEPNGVAESLSIPQIQGAGHRSPYEGHRVTGVLGVVTRTYGQGFAMQVPGRRSDGDPATSDGLWVTTGAPPPVAVGDRVSVTGTVVERSTGGLTVTELAAVGISRQGPMGPVVPTLVGAGGLPPPTEVIDDDTRGDVNQGAGLYDPAVDGLDFHESLEGMLVALRGVRVVGPPDPAGLLPVVVNGGRQASGLSARGVLTRRPGDENPERLFLDVGWVAGDWKVGDGLEGAVTGVVDYGQQRYIVRVQGPVKRRVGALRPETTAAVSPGGLRIASFNLRNFSPLTSDADTTALALRIVEHLGAPDVLALQEVQDESGPHDDRTTAAEQTYVRLLQAIEDVGGPPYAVAEIAPIDGHDGGQPGGNIRVALLFREDGSLDHVERPGGGPTVAVDVVLGLDGPQLTHSPGRIEPGHPAFAQSRKPLVAEFMVEGHRLFVVVVHLVSPFGDGSAFGSLQPPPQPSHEKRRAQAEVVADFVRRVLDLDADAALVVLGDFNAAADSQALAPLVSAGLWNPIARIADVERYTHVYQGQGTALDHLFVSPVLIPGVELDLVHVNVEFAEAPSDHDPVLAEWDWPADPAGASTRTAAPGGVEPPEAVDGMR